MKPPERPPRWIDRAPAPQQVGGDRTPDAASHPPDEEGRYAEIAHLLGYDLPELMRVLGE